MMASCVKIIITLTFVLLLVVNIFAAPVPGKSYQKVRIHIPVKHHTHVITKTRVKTVHVGIPIKESPKHWDEDWAYSKKRTRVTLPEPDDLDY